jgi:hypothetical protein
MGTVISIEEWRGRHADDPDDRLERAVAELDTALRGLSGSRVGDPVVERELLAITGAVSIGMLEDAADRAERLRQLLERRARRGG